jgi:phage regulator Rha-like protein
VFKTKYYKNREKNYIKYLNKRRRKFWLIYLKEY